MYGPSAVALGKTSGIGAKTTRPVGQVEPNGYGLYDMLGNVRQWCQDGFVPYDSSPAKDPGVGTWTQIFQERAHNGLIRGRGLAIRGSWYAAPAWATNPTTRDHAGPFLSSKTLGFRVIATPRPVP